MFVVNVAVAEQGSELFAFLCRQRLIAREVLYQTAKRPPERGTQQRPHSRTPRLGGLPFSRVAEITEQTVPRDYRNRQVHRAFTLER